jgi:hypothetical protein
MANTKTLVNSYGQNLSRFDRKKCVDINAREGRRENVGGKWCLKCEGRFGARWWGSIEGVEHFAGQFIDALQSIEFFLRALAGLDEGGWSRGN